MKTILRRLTATLLIASALLSAASAAVLGNVLRQSTVPLAENVDLTSTVHGKDGTLRYEHVLETRMGEGASPMVIYGNTLYGKSTMEYIEKYPAEWGLSVAAGINGSFFDMLTGIPMGMVITDGCVRSSGTMEAIGFRADGSAIIGYPNLAVTAEFPGGSKLNIHVNKDLTASSGLTLYTRDYETGIENLLGSYNVVLKPNTPDLKLNSRITATVTDIVPDTFACDIPQGCFVLAVSSVSDYAATMDATIKALAVGDTVNIGVTIGDGWGSVVSACAGMGLLITDGTVNTKYILASAKSPTARTAIGLRENGDLVLYTEDCVNGSTGLTLEALARRMLELGCVQALNLDGGGSTAIRVTYPGKAQQETINSPADGQLRKCANFIFLQRTKTAPTEAARLFPYPVGAVALPGGEITLTTTATDAHFNAVTAPAVTYTAQGGTVNGSVFTATAVGTASVTATAGDLSGTTTVQVVETPDRITVSQENGQALPSGIKPGATLDFHAKATYAGADLYVTDKSFVWTCDSAIGTVNENGLFTAAKVYTNTAGKIYCTAGGRTTAVNVTVTADLPFADVETHWAREHILAMYEQGILKGSTVNGVPKFRPDDGMTRQEFLTALTRYLGTAAPAEGEMPFVDAAEIAPWATEAIKAAYAAGYLSGSRRADGLYCDPAATITRQEAMVILSRTLHGEAADVTLVDAFPDGSKAAAWAKQGLADMLQAGVISGTNAGELAPLAPVTRAQVAKMLHVLPAKN